ncbi:MAG TPA: AfsR/SARP family transcriptional regulator, partial [Actinopolymorphaceae bacterium]
WLAMLEREHDNIAAAMRGALTAGDADGAMRLAAYSGWYWWLAGHKVEGHRLLVAATTLSGRVPEEIRAVVYAFVTGFLTSGRGRDQYRAADWIRKAAEIGRRVRIRHPAVSLAGPLERLLHGPEAFLSAFEPALDDEDPWVRALARLQRGKMRIVLGDGGRDADIDLETALDEFRALGERWGMSFAFTELADRVAVRGAFADACAYYEQAIAVVTDVGSTEDLVRLRSRLAQLYWLAGDEAASAAAKAEAQRSAARVTWPEALVELALSKAELARWRGDAEQARRHLGAATAVLGTEAEQPSVRGLLDDMRGYLAEDLAAARRHRRAAFDAVSGSEHAPQIAQVLVGIADLALREERYAQAARLLAASADVRGLPDRSHPDVARIERAARTHLGEARYAEAAREGVTTSWTELAAHTLAS